MTLLLAIHLMGAVWAQTPDLAALCDPLPRDAALVHIVRTQEEPRYLASVLTKDCAVHAVDLGVAAELDECAPAADRSGGCHTDLCRV